MHASKEQNVCVHYTYILEKNIHTSSKEGVYVDYTYVLEKKKKRLRAAKRR